MLRTLVIALMLAIPGAALAQDQFPRSAQDAEVVTDTGVVVGRVAAVERDSDGRIVAVEIPGLEPANAPRAPRDLVADADRDFIPARELAQAGDGSASRGALR